MTDIEKKMKKYIKAIARRLNLPDEVRNRVMSDLTGTISARREAGMTDEEIRAELGTPKKAAADLNERMKEFTYRKSPWRFVFAAGAAFGAAELLGGLVAWLLFRFTLGSMSLFHGEAYSIGIIGGADGPTAIFVTGPNWMGYLIPLLLLTVGIWGFLRLSKCRQKNKKET